VRRSVVLRVVTAAAAAACIFVAIGLSATPASAHTIGGPRPTNYRSRIVGFAPAVPGISARIVDLGAQFELTNRTSTEITVLGYEGEPYLRIGPNGVFENLHSQATYINRTRLGGTVPPLGVDTSPTAVPDWKRISSAHTARWHDHRIHWMSPQPPPPVAQSPGRFYHLSQQNIVFLRGDQRVAIAVSLDWVPGPNGLPWVPVIAALFALGLVAAVAPKRWRLLAVLVGVIVVSDMAHAIGFEIPRPGGNLTKTLQFLGGGFVSVAVWIAAVPTIVTLVRRRVEALYGVVFVGLLIALIGGATDLSALWKSQVPDAGPAWLTRVEVVVALGLGGGLVVSALIRMLRSRARLDHDARGQWLTLLVAGLSDAELARIVPELDADEVLEVALRELAVRAELVAAGFANGSFGFVVTDRADAAGGADPLTWSVAPMSLVPVPTNLPKIRRHGADTSGLRATRGVVSPQAASIRAPFAVVLQLLAGTVRIEDAIARSSVVTTGDSALVALLAPYLPEASGVTTGIEDQASAS
jgi:hypothetical protein